MPVTQRILLCLPSHVLGFILVLVAVAISIASLLIVRRYVPHHKLKVHNDVAGAIFETIGVMYAVLLGFVVVIVWQGFDKSSLNVEKEANCLSDIYRDAESFSPDVKNRARALVLEYADAVITKEWETMKEGMPSLDVRKVIDKMQVLYAGYEPKTENEKLFFQESVHKFNELCELRRFRVLDSRTGIEPVLWLVLLAGAITTTLFPIFFGSENVRAQILMTALLAALIALILFMILVFDFPFTGEVSISPLPFKYIR